MPRILITGSNRGLGLEWVRQYAGLGWHVHATCRDPDNADDLHTLAGRSERLHIHRLDITRQDEIRQLATALTDTPLDLLVNNAGVYFERWGRDRLGGIDYRDWEETWQVNVLGAVRVTEALREQVARSARRLVIAISSHMGSIADITTAHDYAYRSSKAALNAVMRGMALELAPRSTGVLILHPGWVRTRMGGPEAPVLPETSVRGMRALVDRFDDSLSGRFFRYDGSELPW
jgi:NAD(P)-dependent dehydrogenase (short-subunit alcohol dehydrogenase family)